MKIKYLMLSTAALAIAGCSQNEITNMNRDINPEISFGLYTGVQTKGAVTNTAAIYTPGFGVMALNSDKTAVYMTKRQVTSSNSGTSWEYTPAAFWPGDGTSKLSFYSYAPYATSSNGITDTSFDNDATPQIGFAINTTWGDMVDLVAGKNEDAANNSKVSVKLKHILTRIAFTATTNVDISSNSDMKAYITSLKVLKDGTKFYKSGTYALKTADSSYGWSSLAAIDADYNIITSDTEVTGTKTGTPTSLTGAGQYLFCIPVEDLKDNEIKLSVSYKTVFNSIASTKTETIKIPAGGFAKGTAYTYNFEIKLNAIEFSATVDPDWTDPSSSTDLSAAS